MNLTEEEKKVLLKVIQEQLELLDFHSRVYLSPEYKNRFDVLKEIQKKVKLCD